MLDFIVRASDGSVDVDATTAKFMEALLAFQQNEADNNAAIGQAVRAVFAKAGEKTIPKPELRFLTCLELGLAPGDKSKYEAFDTFLTSNPVEFVISAGRSGGVKHVLPKTEAEVTAEAEVAATPAAKTRKNRKAA